MSNLYFNHSYSLRNQTEILELRAEFGIGGYGLYLMLLETIAESETQSINKNLIRGLSLNLNCDIELLKNLINFCVKLKLFLVKGDFIFSKHLQEHFEKRAEIREKRSKAGAKGGKSKASDKQMLSNSKQSKVNKSKVNKINEINKQTIESFFNDSLEVEKIIKENIQPYPNQEWFSEQAKAKIQVIKEKLLTYYTESKKGSKKEIKRMKPTFIQFLESYNQKHFYRYANKVQTPKQQIQIIKKSDYKSNQDLQTELEMLKDMNINFKLI